MTLTVSHFASFHAAVHGGRQPFAWQQRLLEKIVGERRWPRVLDLPTGCGKTTCLDIAVFAIALDASNAADERWCPRRIAMVVDRRIVVDQIAERGRVILHGLVTSSDPVVVEVAARLRSLTRRGEEPLGVFSLRGGMPQDDGWARSPDQPLIVATTVDQVGSRLLMQGYGVSQSMKPVHAGLLANDTLLLLDEVHLSEPFRQTLVRLDCLRQRFAQTGVRTRFAHAFLSATPGGVALEQPFGLLESETAIDSPLGPRLHASKPARLVEVDGRAALERACVEQAVTLIDRHGTIAVVVNRVASAITIARQLAALVPGEVTVTLLTGRMRPLDRDDVLRALRPSVQTGRRRSDHGARHVVVGTQCIEAGADFDFDALVTEAASLDSLRQRFGRVDRLGEYQRAEGVVVFDKSSKDDPIYGKAIVETVRWFKEHEKARSKHLKGDQKKLKIEARTLDRQAKQALEAEMFRKSQVDFGVLALKVPVGEDLMKLLAPKPNAPTLLPAYLDLWAQTSPPPSQIPDVSLWLHGPSAGPADVQVIWRADLTEEVLAQGNLDLAAAIVSALRPSSLEALSLPYAVAKAWLAGRPVRDLGDTEGSDLQVDEQDDAPGRLALRWQGEGSEIVAATSLHGEPALKPGDTLVVPASYGGIRCGCFDAEALEPVLDRAEQAEFFARARPVLRLHPCIVAASGLTLPTDEADEARTALGRLASNDDWPAWKRLWAGRLAKSRATVLVPGDPAWMVLHGRRLPISELRRVVQLEETLEDGIESTTDGDDSFCAGRAVSLTEHSQDVETIAREYAMRCGLGSWLAEHLAFAASLHDIGKADRRFQLLLRAGSEIDYFKDETPWAKSAMPAGSREVRRLARHRSRYPRGARHEVQSVAMLEGRMEVLRERLMQRDATKPPDLDLLLHLVASHHGHCRPFAPVVIDDAPVEVSLSNHISATFGALDFPATSSDHGLHRLDAPLGDRFWHLVEKYGWQELCWLEAILRLADHRASEEEQNADDQA